MNSTIWIPSNVVRLEPSTTSIVVESLSIFADSAVGIVSPITLEILFMFPPCAFHDFYDYWNVSPSTGSSSTAVGADITAAVPPPSVCVMAVPTTNFELHY